MTEYEAFVDRKRRQYGERFDASDLDSRFAPYLNSNQRIKVRFWGQETKTGTVGVTTGWKPAFLLMLTRRSLGSVWLLNADCELLGEARR